MTNLIGASPQIADLKSRKNSAQAKLPMLFSVREVATALGCSSRHVQRLIAAGKLGIVRIGDRQIRIRLEEVERYVAAGAVQAGAADQIGKSILEKTKTR